MSTLTPTAAEPAPRARRRLPSMSWPGLLGLAVLLAWMLAALVGPSLMGQDGSDMGTGDVFARISAQHWLGTDYLGRDMLARVIEGARYTVGVALIATLAASSTGTGSSGTGVSSTAWRTPLKMPSPAIWPRSLIA